MIKSKDIGKRVEIFFYDHSINLDGPVVCSAMGYVGRTCKRDIQLIHWVVHRQDETITEENNEHVSILQAAIIDWTELLPKKKHFPSLVS